MQQSLLSFFAKKKKKKQRNTTNALVSWVEVTSVSIYFRFLVMKMMHYRSSLIENLLAENRWKHT